MIPGFTELRRDDCPICGHRGWCMISDDREKVVCARVPSEIKFGDKGAGWLHKIGEQHRLPAPSLPKKQQPLKLIEWPELVREMMQNATTNRIAPLADELGVSRESLRRMGVGWSASHDAFSFPMYSGENLRPVGVRLRSPDGSKFAIRGSHEGLFLPSHLSGSGPLLICEGPTDTAALLDLDYDVIGRPNCRGAVSDCLAFIKQRRRQEIIIAANYDEPKKRNDGSVFYPGQEGAIELAEKISRPVKIIYPLKHKDFRAWINAGATRATVDLVIKNAGWFRKGAA